MTAGSIEMACIDLVPNFNFGMKPSCRRGGTPRVWSSEVLRLKHATRLSHRQIDRALRIGIGTVTNYLAAAERAGLSWPLPAELDEAPLDTKLWPPAPAGKAK